MILPSKDLKERVGQKNVANVDKQGENASKRRHPHHNVQHKQLHLDSNNSKLNPTTRNQQYLIVKVNYGGLYVVRGESRFRGALLSRGRNKKTKDRIFNALS